MQTMLPISEVTRAEVELLNDSNAIYFDQINYINNHCNFLECSMHVVLFQYSWVRPYQCFTSSILLVTFGSKLHKALDLADNSDCFLY